MVSTAQGAASSLLEILDDVLDIAKMDAEAMELDRFEVPVRLLVRGMLEALSVKVRGNRVELRDDIESDVPFVIVGDPKRLRQILMNLCGNALKFTHEGTVTVRVTKKTQIIKNTKKQLALRFEVIDTGIGMSEETCSRLFQSFTQADSSTARKYGGTGLGLSISKKLVDLMDGKIGVTSEPGKGSIFWFEIPTAEVSTDATTVILPKLEGISVLSVEDHPQGAREIMNSLRSMGAKIENCGTYADALELARIQRFDVAVIDQGLPDGLGP
jgi:two-component system sensor histidine kinase/response regulator